MFLVSELAYYLRGPALMAAAMKARQAELEKRAEFERGGVTLEGSFHTTYQVWQEVLKKESADLSKMWTAADADAFGQVLLHAFEVAQHQTARLPISSRSGALRNIAAMPALCPHNASANAPGGASMAPTRAEERHHAELVPARSGHISLSTGYVTRY